MNRNSGVNFIYTTARAQLPLHGPCHAGAVDAIAQLPDNIAVVKAANAGPMTLDGTNTYVVCVGDEAGTARSAWMVDPGPADDAHLQAVLERTRLFGDVAGIVLTHDHFDHAEGVDRLNELAGGGLPVLTIEQRSELPFESFHTPGHAPDHLVFRVGDQGGGVLLSGDLILGDGFTIVPPDGGSLIAYLDSLRLIADLNVGLIGPGHGPMITDPAAKIEEYIEHRLARERALLDALERGLRDREELLDAAWADVKPNLRLAAAFTMVAHLEKLQTEGRLPADVDVEALRPVWY